MSDLRVMRAEQAEMKATLLEVSGNMKKVVWLVFTMFLTSLGALVYRGVAAEKSAPQSASISAVPHSP